jgi:hypothetical protein
MLNVNITGIRDPTQVNEYESLQLITLSMIPLSHLSGAR